MSVDITEQFFQLFQESQISQLHKNSNEDIQESIQAKICNKQAQDLFTSLSKINSIMTETRENYFSNAAYSYSAFTDQQRNQFNQEIKLSLDSTNVKLTEFKEAIESIECQNVTEKEHFRGLAICLYQLFKQSSAIFRQFLQFYEKRKQKFQNTMSKVSQKTKKQIKLQKERSSEDKMKLERKISSIDEELEQQSKTIFMQRASQQQRIEDTKKTLQQINQVLSQMSNKVLDQELLTSSFKDIGEIGLENIEKGNKNLVQANSLAKQAGKYWSYYFLFLAFSLLLLDFLKS